MGKTLSEKLRLKDFGFFFSLQVGVVVVCCFGLVMTVLAFLKLCFNPLVEDDTGVAAVSYLIVVIFILASSVVYILGLVGAALEDAPKIKIAGFILICVAIYWFLLMCLSFSGDCNILRHVCVDNRCAERLFIQNGYWRPPRWQCGIQPVGERDYYDREVTENTHHVTTATPPLYPDEGDATAVPELDEHSASVAGHSDRMKRAPLEVTTSLQKGKEATVFGVSRKRISEHGRQGEPKGYTRGRKFTKGSSRREKQSRGRVEYTRKYGRRLDISGPKLKYKNNGRYEEIRSRSSTMNKTVIPPVENGLVNADQSYNNDFKVRQLDEGSSPQHLNVQVTTNRVPNDTDAGITPTNVAGTDRNTRDSSISEGASGCTMTTNETTSEDCLLMCECYCQPHEGGGDKRAPNNSRRSSDNDTMWTPIGHVGQKPHFVLSIVYACLILPLWYLYPIWLMFSLAAQIQHGEVV